MLKMTKKRIAVFTDLDGTLLDHSTYSFDAAKPAIKMLKKNKIPLIFCTSKTRAEQEPLRKKVGTKDPFIVEDGSAIYIPKGYFKTKIRFSRKTKDYNIIEFGTPFSKIKKIMKELKKTVELEAFHDMSIPEVMKDTGLNRNMAKRALTREYSTGFKLKNEKDEKKVRAFMKKKKLNITVGGRYYHVYGGGSDKGKAVLKTTKLFEKEWKEKVESIALGDSENDFAMLKAADKSTLVERHNKTFSSDKFCQTKGIGPIGWNKFVMEVVKND